MATAISKEVTRLLKLRDDRIDQAVEDFAIQAERVAENIGRRLIAALGENPDDWREPDGDDGVRILSTDLEQRLMQFEDPAQLRASILSMPIVEIQDFMNAAGNDLRDANLQDVIAELAGYAEETLYITGETTARQALDTVAAEALIESYVGRTVDTIRDVVDGPARARIRDALTANLGEVSAFELAELTSSQLTDRIPLSLTEAYTRLAEADNFVNEVLRTSLESALEAEDGEQDEPRFLMAYRGPDDALERPFCDTMNNHAFTISQLKKADNAQGLPVRTSCGGYRCRHKLIPVRDDDELLKDLGLKRGTAALIDKANRAAKSARRKGGSRAANRRRR